MLLDGWLNRAAYPPSTSPATLHGSLYNRSAPLSPLSANRKLLPWLGPLTRQILFKMAEAQYALSASHREVFGTYQRAQERAVAYTVLANRQYIGRYAAKPSAACTHDSHSPRVA